MYTIFNTRPIFSDLFFDEGDGGGGGGGNPPNAGGDSDPNAQDDKNKGGNGGDGKPNPPKTFTQEDVDRIVAERVEREKKAREKAEQKAKEEAEAKSLAENQKWQELAQKHESTITDLNKQIAELEPFKSTAERYETSLKAFLKTEREGLPAHILTLLDKLDVVDQLEYIANNRATLKSPNKPGPDPSPDPADPKELTDAQKKDATTAAARTYKSLL